MKTSKSYTTEFRNYGTVTVPAGTKVSHQTAMGLDTRYNFVDEFGWVKKSYPDYYELLIMDLKQYGLNVPADHVIKDFADFLEPIVINVPDPVRLSFCGYEIRACKTVITKDGANIEGIEDGEEPEFWAVYGLEHQPDGEHLPMNIADCATQPIALDFAKDCMITLFMLRRNQGGKNHE